MSDTPENKKQMYTVGGNLAALSLYTLLCKTISGGFLLDGCLIFVQVVICICFDIAKKSWYWLLSVLVVLLIGVSTCAVFFAELKVVLK